MWNPVKYVANIYKLDPDVMEKFATENSKKYSIVNQFGYNEVNTWHCDDFVKDFKLTVK